MRWRRRGRWGSRGCRSGRRVSLELKLGSSGVDRCMYVCMHVCMDGWIYAMRVYGYEHLNVCTDVALSLLYQIEKKIQPPKDVCINASSSPPVGPAS